MGSRVIRIQDICEGFTPRRTDEGKEELRDSIAREGLLEPLLVRKNGSVYEIIDGIRRFRAVKELGWKSVECRIIETSEERSLRIAYIRNTERRNFSPLEDAVFLQSLKDRFGYNNEDLVREGYAPHRATIDNKLSLLDLPQEIRDKITHDGPVTASKGYEIARVPDEDTQRELAAEVQEKGLSCREVKDKVRSLNISRKREEEGTLDPVEIPEGEIPGVYIKDSQDMSELEDTSVGLVVTSPPYGVEMEYEKGVSFEDHLAVLDGVFKECVRVLVPGGKICVNVGDILTYGSRVHGKPEIEPIGHHILGIMHNHGMRLIDRIIWNKGLNWVNNPQVSYHRKIQHTSYRILNNFEYIFIFQKNGKREVPFDVETESKISKEEWKTLVNGVWEIPPVRKQKDHPAQFPEEIPRRLIKMFSYKGDLVLDPFGGTMTTLKVAKELGRRGVGYEKDETYKPAIMKKLGIGERDLRVPAPQKDVQEDDSEGADIMAKVQRALPAVLSAEGREAKDIMSIRLSLDAPAEDDEIEVEFDKEERTPPPEASAADGYEEEQAQEQEGSASHQAPPQENGERGCSLPEANQILLGDSREKLKKLPDDSVDLLVTDPPYGMKFMGKDWDQAVPEVDLWKECLRVLKPGAFAYIMSIPRQDCQSRMVRNLEEAGFKVGFTPMYWARAQGFPKAHSIGKAVDKKLGAEREKLQRNPNSRENCDKTNTVYRTGTVGKTAYVTAPASESAKRLEGSYGGFQPKPAVEVILVAMKPMDEKGYVDQALKNGKGITWLDDCRVPYADEADREGYEKSCRVNGVYETGLTWGGKKVLDVPKAGRRTADFFGEVGEGKNVSWSASPTGRFPANLLVSDGVLEDAKSHPVKRSSFSRYFSLDAWAEKNFPFFIVPKPSSKEKNAGCEGIEAKETNRTKLAVKCKKCGKYPVSSNPQNRCECEKPEWEGAKQHNFHPTVKPIKLMAYLITMGSRKNDVVLDPFCGSGTTCIAAKELNRKFIGVEINEEYREIAEKRVEAACVAKAA